VLISEFRLNGPGGAQDEFIELYNNTDAPITVTSSDGSISWALARSGDTIVATLADGTFIPARGHYLITNSNGYSLAAVATANQVYAADIPGNTGIALFNAGRAASFTFANRLDAVGSTSETNALYKEGAGYPAITPALNTEFSFYRNLNTATGTPKDMNNNAADFLYVDTAGTDSGAGARLGAPGPENLSSPVQRNDKIKASLIDPGCSGTSTGPDNVTTCARNRNPAPTTNGTQGTFSFRRRFTNNTGAAVTRLRFRIVDITTAPQTSGNGTADLRAITSTGYTSVCTGSGGGCPGGAGTPVNIEGTTLEAPPAQASGGGFNSTLSAGTITLGTPLASGAGINLQFTLGVQQTGNFRFFINVEALL
jgi:hypothetical protein